jgi:VWFA-related protein
MRITLRKIALAFLMFVSLCAFGIMPFLSAAKAEDKAPDSIEDARIQGQEPSPAPFKFTTAVNLVTTDVTVIGKPSYDLRAADFTVFDNGTVQQIDLFSQDQLPLAIVLLIDTSSSVQKYLPVLQIAGGSALRHLQSEDQVALYSFNENPRKVTDLTRDRILIAKEIGKLDFNFGTDIYLAISNAAKYLRKNAPNRRRAIVMISDNCQIGYSNSNSALAKVLEADASVYSIKTPGDNQGWNGCFESNNQVRQIAEDTGGELIDLTVWTSLPEALDKVISNLRKQYTLGFSPSAAGAKGSFHKLAVKLATERSCNGCRLLSRKGYYSDTQAPAPVPADVLPAPQHSEEKTNQMLIQQSILVAGTTDVNLGDLPFKVSTAPQTDPGGQRRIKVDLQIDSAHVKFKSSKDGDLHTCKLHITVFYINDNGKILGSDWRILEGRLKEETYQQTLKSGLHNSFMVPVKAEKQNLKVVIYDEESDRAGSSFVKLAEVL